MNIIKTMGFRAGVVSALVLLVFVSAWYVATASSAGTGTAGVLTQTADQIKR